MSHWIPLTLERHQSIHLHMHAHKSFMFGLLAPVYFLVALAEWHRPYKSQKFRALVCNSAMHTNINHISNAFFPFASSVNFNIYLIIFCVRAINNISADVLSALRVIKARLSGKLVLPSRTFATPKITSCYPKIDKIQAPGRALSTM